MGRHRWFKSQFYNVVTEGSFVKIINKHTNEIEETYSADSIKGIDYAITGGSDKHYIYFKDEAETKDPEININITRDDFDDVSDDEEKYKGIPVNSKEFDNYVDRLLETHKIEKMINENDMYHDCYEEYMKKHAKKDYLLEKARTNNFEKERREISGIENLSPDDQNELLFLRFAEKKAEEYANEKFDEWFKNFTRPDSVY